jgi:hypothetical protein
VQRHLIARAVRLVMIVELLERRIIESGKVADISGRQILAYIGQLGRILAMIGVKPAVNQPKRLSDVIKLAG